MGEKNVGTVDSIIRILIGIICVGLAAAGLLAHLFPIYGLIPLAILIPFFLKTGATRVCPIMKAMNISTNKKKE